MSRSRKKTPIFNHTTAESNKLSKRWCNRKFRRHTKLSVKNNSEPPQNLNEVMTEWEFQGDGKFYWKNVPPSFMKK